MPSASSCDPQVLRALRAELHRHPGGHQASVQQSVATLTTDAARCILNALRDQDTKIHRMKREPWGRF